MKDKTLTQVYCSIDLELSGFDPLKDEILEVGFVFFSLSAIGAQILEEWSQVFKPTKPVHPKILGLTGLAEEELEAAPAFADSHEFLSEKLATRSEERRVGKECRSRWS